jgi:hypothetical protein
MVPGMTLPASLLLVLEVTRPCFTKHSFETFCQLATGMVAQTGRRTVTGMLTGAGLARVWPHRRAHAFFEPSLSDMVVKLGRVIIAARFMPTRPGQPTEQEIRTVQQAWAAASTDAAA